MGRSIIVWPQQALGESFEKYVMLFALSLHSLTHTLLHEVMLGLGVLVTNSTYKDKRNSGTMIL